MVPLLPNEEPCPYSTMPDIDTLFDEMIAGIGGNPADARDSLSTFSPPVPGPYPTTGLPMHINAQEDNSNVFVNVPAGIQKDPPSLTPQTAVKSPMKRVTYDIQADQHATVRNLETLRFADMFQQEQPYRPIPGAFQMQQSTENRTRTEREAKLQEHTTGQIRETNSLLMQNKTKGGPSTPFIPSSTQNPWREVVSNERGVFSRLSDVSPTSTKSERPVKRQRMANNAAGVDRISRSSQLFSDPSTQAKNLLVQDSIRQNNISPFFSMPVLDDEAIQQNLMANDIGYQRSNAAGFSANTEGDSAARQERDYPLGYVRRAQGSAMPASNIPLYALGFNAKDALTSGLLSQLPSTAANISDSPCNAGSRNIIHGRSSLDEVGTVPPSGKGPRANVPPLSLNPKTIPILNIERIPQANLTQTETRFSTRISPQLTTEPLSGNFSATENEPGSSEISAHSNELPGIPSISEDLGDFDETTSEISVEEEFYSTEMKEIHTHYAIVSLENPPECEICNNLYITKQNLKRHMKAVHTQSESHLCEECGIVCKNKTNLDRHVYNTHQDRNHFCDSCGAGFNTKRALVSHERDQHGVTPASVQRTITLQQSRSRPHEKKVLTYYQCLLCPHTSTVKGNLMRHVRGKHLHEEPFSCRYCRKRAKTKQNIEFHEKACSKRPQDVPGEN